MTVALEPPDFPRDRWGRPRINVDGRMVSYARPSSYGDCIDNRYNLERWIRRNILLGLKADHSLYARLAAVDAEDRDALNALCEDGLTAAKAHSRADLGSALHKMTERVDRGEELDLPPVFAADVDAYRKAMDGAGLTVVPGMIELRCVCDEIQAAGSFDRVVEDSHGLRYIADLKTGASSDYPHGFAVQLAIYAHSLLYDVTTGERSPMPNNLSSRYGVIIHLPAGDARCSVYQIDLDKGWEAAQRAKWVKDTWQKDKSLLTPLAKVEAPEPEALVGVNPARLRERCQWIKEQSPLAYQALRGRWPAGIDLRGTAISEADALLMAELVAEIEDAYKIPFDTTEPEPVRVPPPPRRVEKVIAPPDEGRPADPVAVKDLEAKVNALPDEAGEWIKAIATAAHAAGAGLSLRKNPSLRRFEIARGLYKLAARDLTERLPELVALVVGDVPGTPAGLIATFSADDAEQFARHVDLFVIRMEDADTPELQLGA